MSNLLEVGGGRFSFRHQRSQLADKDMTLSNGMMIWQSIFIRIWWYDNPSLWGYDDMAVYTIGLRWFYHWWDIYAHFAMIYFSSLPMKGYLIWFEHTIWRYANAILNGVQFAADADSIMLWPGLRPHWLQAGWEMWPLKMCASKNEHQFTTSNSPPPW